LTHPHKCQNLMNHQDPELFPQQKTTPKQSGTLATHSRLTVSGSAVLDKLGRRLDGDSLALANAPLYEKREGEGGQPFRGTTLLRCFFLLWEKFGVLMIHEILAFVGMSQRA